MFVTSAFRHVAAAVLLAGLAAAWPARAQAPVGLGLEGIAYPHPVRYLAVDVHGAPARMAYMDVAPQGAANGRTVVLLHGRNFFGEYWSATITALTARGYRVVVPDQVGFGKSSKPDAHLSLHLLARHTHALLEHLGVRRAHVVAHSLGGMVGIRFALMYPDMVDRLVLEAPIGLEDYRIRVPYAALDELEAEALRQGKPDIDRFFRSFFARWDPAWQLYADVAAGWLAGPEASRAARTAALTYTMAWEQPVVYELGLLDAPTLIVASTRDRAAIGRNRVPAETRSALGDFPKLTAAACQAIRRCERVLLDDVGHVPHLESPERFHAQLLAFLEQP
jgi:pimeloyl-ACP methyl ester carboxylesterase